MYNNCYDNRELSWLKFNERVLSEAADPQVPIGERLLFCSIYQTNLDEFFMIRVGSLYDRTLVDDTDKDNKSGLTASEQLSEIYKRATELCSLREKNWKSLLKELNEYDIDIIHPSELKGEENELLRVYWNKEIKPLISPHVVDKRHPFPFLANKDTYLAVHLDAKNSVKMGIIACSGSFPRIIIHTQKNKIKFILTEEVIAHFASEVFENYKIIDKSIIRVTRNADINMEEGLYDEDVDLRHVMEELLKKRKKLSPVRLELSHHMNKAATDYLCEKLELSEEQLFYSKTPHDMSFVFQLRSKIEEIHPDFFYKSAKPQDSAYIEKGKKIIPQIQKKDILLSYPYESIKPFIALLNEAAEDPDVVSIKITLYRVARNSKIVEALVNAAENGKEVFVLVELRARFDEENNIGWSKLLEEAGCTVVYGPQNLKVHSKLLLITRKDESGLGYVTQIGTGNYNEKTSALYTDLSLMTADRRIGEEASRVFNALAIGTLVENTEYLMVAPLSLQNKIIDLIDEEIAYAKAGGDAYIGLKLNSLTDKILMDKLIEASGAGVHIDMVIRGICCLVAGVKGYTENITVRSIVGRYLEHSRIYMFGKGERMNLYISSADFMTRNTLRRVEVAAPVYDESIRERIVGIFDTMLADNIKSRIMLADGTYVYRAVADKSAALGDRISCQEKFIEEAYKNASKGGTAVRNETVNESPETKEKQKKKPIRVKIKRVGR